MFGPKAKIQEFTYQERVYMPKSSSAKLEVKVTLNEEAFEKAFERIKNEVSEILKQRQKQAKQEAYSFDGTRPATEKQLGLIAKLRKERSIEAGPDDEAMTVGEASGIIDSLLSTSVEKSAEQSTEEPSPVWPD